MRSHHRLPPVHVSNPMIRGLSAESEDSSDNEVSREYVHDSNDIPTKALRLLGLSAADFPPKHNDGEEGLPYLTTSIYARENYRGLCQASSSGNLTPVQGHLPHHSVSSAPATPVLPRPQSTSTSKSGLFRKAERPTSSSSTSPSFSHSQFSKDGSERSSWERSSSIRTPSLSYHSASGSEGGHGQERDESRRQDSILPLTMSSSRDGQRYLFSPSVDHPSYEDTKGTVKSRPKMASRSHSSSGLSASKGLQEELESPPEPNLKSKTSFTQKLFASRSRSPSNVNKEQKSKKTISNLLGDNDFNFPPLSAPAFLDIYDSNSMEDRKERLEDETEEIAHEETDAPRSRRSYGGKKSSLAGSNVDVIQAVLTEQRSLADDLEDRCLIENPDLYLQRQPQKQPSFKEPSYKDFRNSTESLDGYSEKNFRPSRRNELERRDSEASLASTSASSRKDKSTRVERNPSSSTSSLKHRSSGKAEIARSRFEDSGEEISKLLNRTDRLSNLTTSHFDSGSPAPAPPAKAKSRRPRTSSGVISSQSDQRPANPRTASGSQLSVVGGDRNLFDPSDSPFSDSSPFSSYAVTGYEEGINRFQEELRIQNRMESRKSSFGRAKFIHGWSKFLS